MYEGRGPCRRRSKGGASSNGVTRKRERRGLRGRATGRLDGKALGVQRVPGSDLSSMTGHIFITIIMFFGKLCFVVSYFFRTLPLRFAEFSSCTNTNPGSIYTRIHIFVYRLEFQNVLPKFRLVQTQTQQVFIFSYFHV